VNLDNKKGPAQGPLGFEKKIPVDKIVDQRGMKIRDSWVPLFPS